MPTRLGFIHSGVCREARLAAGRRLRAASTVCVFLAVALHGGAAERDGLSASQSARLDSVVDNYHVEHCCGASLGECLSLKRDQCPIADHLYAFSSWLVEIESEPEKIGEQLDKRYGGFVDDETFAIDTSTLEWAGDTTAPVAIVAYVSSTCNLCKHIVGALRDSVTTGSLRGKAKLMAKPFGAGVGDIGLLAANTQRKYWELFEAMEQDKSRYKESTVIRMAESIGIDPKAFQAMLHDPAVREAVDESREEGVRNGVEVTPTFFINSRRYRSYKDPRWVVDAAHYEYGTR